MSYQPKALVFGHYDHRSRGDDLFIPAFQRLFPDVQLTFIDRITVRSLVGIDAVFVGGGSFLTATPAIDDDALPLLQRYKLFYLGVGMETGTHPIHQRLMGQATLVATRTPLNHNKAQHFNTNVVYVPDLVFALQDKVVLSSKKLHSVLVLPNVYLIPRWNGKQWQESSWAYFKSEFAQALDTLAKQDYDVDFFAMCRHDQMNDDWAAAELINKMQHRGRAHILPDVSDTIEGITALISRYPVVITQRFHGIVLSEMTRTPYVSVHHHDKLKPCQWFNGVFTSYYGTSKNDLLDQFERAQQVSFLPIPDDAFTLMQEKVNQSLGTT